jgi:hypothetical protein
MSADSSNRSGSSRLEPILHKMPSSSVPYGSSISLDGEHVWAAYRPDGETLVCVGATPNEARRKYRAVQRVNAKNVYASVAANL